MNTFSVRNFFALSFTLFFTFTIHLSTTAQDYFTWDNSTVYFLLTDRFYDGDNTNNYPYGRTTDPIGGFQGGDLKGLTQKINEGYFDDLGVDAIWFTAPYEQIHGAVPGYWNGYPSDNHYAYHGYYALDFTEVDANMGTTADMQAFVDAAHAKGIRVVMDIVVNHVGYETVADENEFGLGELGDPWQDPNTGLNANDPDWCNWWTDDNGVAWIRKGDTDSDFCATACGGGDLELCLAGLPDVRTELTTAVGLPKILQTKWDAAKEAQEISELNTFFSNTGLTATPANHIIKWLTDWVRDYGIDGFRIDTYKHAEREIWGELKVQAQDALDDWKAANPAKVLDNNDFWMVGEWYGHGPNKNTEAATTGKTDALINFNFQGIAGDPSALESTYNSYATIAADPEWNFLSYISSHDTDLFDRNDLMDAATSLLLAPGAVQIFYGDETKRLPLTTGSDQDTRSMMNWGNFDNTLRDHWAKVGSFRQAHPAVGAGAHQQLDASPYTFMRDYINAEDGICDRIVAAVGLSSGPNTVNVAGAFADGEQIKDYYTGNTATVSGGQVTLNVGSGGVLLLEYITSPACIAVDISPDICSSVDPVEVTITAIDGANPMTTPTIYYTFDPVATTVNLMDWTVYTMPFTLTQSETVFAFAKNTNGDESEIVSQNYTIGGTGTMTVRWKAMGCATPYVYAWEMDGIVDSELAPWPGVPMSGPDGNGYYEYTINAAFSNLIFNCNGGNQSEDLFACGDVCYDNGIVDCPVFGPSVNIVPTSSNHAGGSVDVTITARPGSCDIYYTTDGSTPTTGSTLYAGTFTINGIAGNPVTVKAIADCSGTLTSIDEETYTFDMVSTMTLYWNAANTGCATPYLYAWNLDGQPNSAIAPWPGVAMTNPDGDGWFEYTLTASTANVIFSCNGGNQTTDLMASGDACYDGGWVSCTPSVSILPLSGNYPSGSVDVTLSAGPGASCTIYYTTDGSTPTIGSTLYAGTFNISGSSGNPVTVKAIADCGGTTTAVSEETYTFDMNASLTLYWNPEGSCATPYLYAFDIDGVDDTENAPFPGEPMVDSDGDGWHEYTLEGSGSMVIFNCMGSGTNNQTADLSVSGDACFQGKANQNMDAGMFVTCPDFDAPKVFIEPIGGNYTDGSVTVSLSSENATAIYYTTDGSMPDNSSTLYVSPFPINNSMGSSLMIKAIAYNGNDASDVESEVYTFSQQSDDKPIIVRWNPEGSCATPYLYAWELDGVLGTELAPFPGVPMTDEDGDGWYEYTLDAASSNIIFSCGSNQNQTENLFVDGHACFQGNVGNGNFVSCPDFNEPSVTIMPNGGMYLGGSNVAVTLPSAEATAVYYTTDGSTPDNTSTLYSGVFNVTGTNETITVQAIAYSGSSTSAVVFADFVFDKNMTCPPTIDVDGTISGGTYQAANTLTSDAIMNTGVVIFEAGMSITLMNGFHANPSNGADQFIARIQACSVANSNAVESRTVSVKATILDLKIMPNPFSGKAQIRYFLAEEGTILLNLMDINGQQVKTIQLENQQVGWQNLSIDASDLSSGIYFLNLRTANEFVTKKLVIMD